MEQHTENIEKTRINQGYNIKKVRQLMGVKQEDLASMVGVSQPMISQLEQQKLVGKEMLVKIANVLNVPIQIIESMEDDPLSVIVENNTFNENNTFENGSTDQAQTFIGSKDSNIENNSNQQIHPLDRVMELVQKSSELFERVIAIEKEKSALLKQLLDERKKG